MLLQPFIGGGGADVVGMGLAGAVQRRGNGLLGIEAGAPLQNGQAVLHHVGGGGHLARTLSIEALPSDVFPLVGDQVEVGRHGGL